MCVYICIFTHILYAHSIHIYSIHTVHACIFTCIYYVSIMCLYNIHFTDHDGRYHPQPHTLQYGDPRGNPIPSLPLDKHTVLARIPGARQFV